MELTSFHCLISISMATQERASSSHGVWNGYEFENTSPWIRDENHSFYFYFLNFVNFFLKSLLSSGVSTCLEIVGHVFLTSISLTSRIEQLLGQLFLNFRHLGLSRIVPICLFIL